MNKKWKDRIFVLFVLFTIFAFIGICSFTMKSCVEELHSSGGVKPVLSELWCGTKDCLK